jgi:hypothetical protein
MFMMHIHESTNLNAHIYAHEDTNLLSFVALWYVIMERISQELKSQHSQYIKHTKLPFHWSHVNPKVW